MMLSEWIRTQMKHNEVVVDASENYTEPRELDTPPVVLVCHYKNPLMTTMCICTLLKTNPWVKKVLIVDTSEEQDAPAELDKRVQIISLKGGNHSQGVQKGLDWARTKIYAGHKRGHDKWVLLIDSDVLFDHDVSGIIHNAREKNYVLTGHEHPKRTNMYGMTILSRIHPAFCLMNVSWLFEKKIPFCNWSKIKPQNMPCLSNTPGQWNPKEVRERGLSQLYDAGGTMFEEVNQNGGKIWNLGPIWVWNNDKEKAPRTVYHIGESSWAPNDEKFIWAKNKTSEICGVV